MVYKSLRKPSMWRVRHPLSSTDHGLVPPHRNSAAPQQNSFQQLITLPFEVTQLVPASKLPMDSENGHGIQLLGCLFK